MSNLARRGPVGLKPDGPTAADRAAGRAHMARVAQLPCIICGARPVEVHHCISGRFGQRRVSDFDTIPLCARHHREGPFSIHGNKALWVATNGPDTDFLPRVAALLADHDMGAVEMIEAAFGQGDEK
ncbi:DUF968 domain-containing protein [Paracoccus suum]|uniref:DUF968 domain-containing protein n=1 Tax=Paracoccus suum TaxID=2259340 RepID=A0A344PKX3_9RHOB|nr:DUF968 domain-containing protein [Paracoccus suum]AXC50028.1 DUF968 domain-containing protein [Paracoccus suum]